MQPGKLKIDPMRYAIVIEKGERNYSAYVPDLPGCVSVGDTLEDVKTEIREAIELHLEGMREDGFPIPKPSSKAEYVEVANRPGEEEFSPPVLAGLVPAIHAAPPREPVCDYRPDRPLMANWWAGRRGKPVDGRDKPGHDVANRGLRGQMHI